MGNAYWNKPENINSNREGRIVPEQLAHVRKAMMNSILGFVAGVGIGGFVAVAAFPKYPVMAVFFGVVGLIVGVICATLFFDSKKVVAGSGSVRPIEGVARREIVRAGVRLYLDDEFIYCSNGLAHKFEEGQRYRIFVAMPTRMLLSAEKI